MKPAEYLEQQIIGKPVIVKLNTGVVYRGLLGRFVSPLFSFSSSFCHRVYPD